MKIYAIKDTIRGEFTPAYVFVETNDETATRTFADAVNAPAGEIAKYHRDFDMYRLGEINIKTGEIKSEVEHMCNGTAVKTVIVDKED